MLSFVEDAAEAVALAAFIALIALLARVVGAS